MTLFSIFFLSSSLCCVHISPFFTGQLQPLAELRSVVELLWHPLPNQKLLCVFFELGQVVCFQRTYSGTACSDLELGLRKALLPTLPPRFHINSTNSIKLQLVLCVCLNLALEHQKWFSLIPNILCDFPMDRHAGVSCCVCVYMEHMVCEASFLFMLAACKPVTRKCLSSVCRYLDV